MLDAYVIDTDVLSYILKGDTRATPYRQYLTNTIVVISFMSVAELERWAIERNWSATRRAGLRCFLDAFINRPVDRALCETWATIMADARRRGTPIAHADAGRWQQRNLKGCRWSLTICAISVLSRG